MDIDIKNRLDALLKKIEDQDSDTATLSPGISPLTEKLLLYLGVQLDNLDITTELEKLKDVEIEGPAHHQALVYDAEKEKWVNDYVEGGAAGATKLDELTDVHLSGLEDGESLVYDSASGKWTNKMVDTSIFMEDIVDTDIEGPRSGQVLVYNGDEITWKNSDALIGAEAKISALESTDSAIKSSVDSVAARATALETRAANLEQEYGQQQASLIVLSSQITYATHVAEGALNNEAAEYQTNVQYFPGDYCTYQYGLYRCIGNTNGAWNNAKWERVKVCDEIKLVKASAASALEIAGSAAASATSAWDKAESATGVATSAANVAATALESANIAYSNAATAMESASEAVGVATSALESATGAYEVAGSALSSSGAAYSLASTAAASASEAWDVASSAAETAGSALSSAESAFSLANAAKESAEAAYVTADSAVSIAIGASEDASEALSSAQAAYGAAQSAKTSAQSAIQTADSAMTLASAATTSAQTAIETANAAKTSADLAYGTADSALSSAEAAYASASSAFYIAGVALADASAAGALAQSATQQAIDAARTANSAITDAGTAITTANSAFASASDAITFAQVAQASADSAISIATGASNSAAAAYTSAQTAISTADSALSSAQSAYTIAGQAKTSAQSAYSKAESALSSAETAYTTAESALTSASSAYTYATQAKASAQTAYNTATAAASDAADALLIAGVASSDAAAALDSASTAISTANSALTSAQTAYTTASAAKTSAQSAYTMADEAKTSAATAVSTANSAKTSAQTAYNTASAAKTSADLAYITADSAYTIAVSASGVADSALTSAQAAYTSAGDAYSIATSALASSSSAYTKATAAQTSANTAITNAATAQSSANTAISKANTAQSSANTAITNAATAQASANTALANASAAQTSADTAIINAATAQSTADSAYALASAALPNTTKYGSSITVSINSTNYKITTTLKDQDGNTLGNAQTIDLPLESVVVNGTFDSANKKIVLTLQNGNTVDIPVGDLVAGLQTEITDENKLNSDLVTDSNQTHKFVTAAQISKLNGIAAGAEVNVQSDWNVSDSSLDSFIKNKPSIPTVNNATLTVKQNGTSKGTFTANASSNSTIELTDTNTTYTLGADGDTVVLTPSSGSSQSITIPFATTASKLNTNAGSKFNPVYFSSGMPVAADGNVIPYVEGTGSTAGVWAGSLTGVTAYYDGLLILYKIPIAGASGGVTLNLNSLGAKTVYFNNAQKLTTHFPKDQPILLVYSASQNSGCWMIVDNYNSDTKPQAICGTAAATAGKTADCTYYALKDNSYLTVIIRYANTSASALTLNINSTGAKSIYINGTASSSTNYTLPAGSYLVYYNDSKYYFRTDGKITGNITGDAATVSGYTVGINIPSTAVFTDEKVKITEDTSTSENFRILFDTSHNNSTVTESVSKNRNLVYNPSTGVFYTPREVINTTDNNIPLIIRTDGRSAVPANGDDITIFNGAFKKTVSGTTSTLYNSVISLIGNNASTGTGVVRFGSSVGATIITGGAGAKAFPKNFVNTDSTTGKYNSDGAIWLAAQSEVHIYTNASNSAAKFGGHIWMNQGGLRVDRTDASAGTLNNMYLVIGNNTAKSNAGAAKGTIQIWDRNSSGTAYSAKISPNTLTQERTITIPDESGIIQLQSGWELHGIIECDGVNMEYETTLPDGVTGVCMYPTDYVAASSFSDPLSIYGTFSDNTGISILRDVMSNFVVTDISHDGLWINQISTKNGWRPGITSLEEAYSVMRSPVINKNSLKKIKISTVFGLNPPPEGLNIAIYIRKRI